MPKVINIEPTPNPNALKFVVKSPVLRSGARSFQTFEASVGDSLGSSLFALGGVASVFYMDRFVTVNKEQAANWNDLIDRICECIEDLKVPEAEISGPVFEGTTDEKLMKILEVLDEKVRPALAGDGGGLEVLDFDGETLRIAYQGACGSCPSAQTGTLHFIESLVQAEVDAGIRVMTF